MLLANHFADLNCGDQECFVALVYGFIRISCVGQPHCAYSHPFIFPPTRSFIAVVKSTFPEYHAQNL